MKKTTSGILLVLSVCVTRAADIATTHHFLRGDMTREGNPLALCLGFSWSELLIANLLVGMAILLGITFYALGQTKKLLRPASTASEFAGLCIYGQRLSLGQLILRMLAGWPLPKDWYQLGRLFAFSLSAGLAASGFAAVFSWWSIWGLHWEWMSALRSIVVFGRYSFFEISVGLIVCIYAACGFFRSEMKLANEGASDVDVPSS